jgi:hypothetical protein
VLAPCERLGDPAREVRYCAGFSDACITKPSSRSHEASERLGFADAIYGDIITTVGKKRFGGWQGIKDQPRTFVIAHLPLAEQQNEGFALAVADSVELRVQAAFRAPNASGNSPFFKRLAAVRCKMGGVDHNRSGFGPSLASAAKIRSNTPSLLQRMKRL